MGWKNVFAYLVYLAVDKGYAPDEVWENQEAFEKAYKDFFGVPIDDPHPFGAKGNRILDEEFRDDLRPILNACMGSDYASRLMDDDRFYEDVKRNVEETSAWFDEGVYTEDDIRLAIGRVLLENLGVDYE